jgi:transcriptional regulator with XRE-family HTH domain
MREDATSQRGRRSLRVRKECLALAIQHLEYKSYNRTALAVDIGASRQTVSNFFNGKSVDRSFFREICEILGLDWQAITETDSLELEFSEGIVPIDSAFYVQSPKEADCYREVERPGSLIRIQSPRQMGKSSLLLRIAHHAEREGCQSAYINLRQTDGEICANRNAFLRWLCTAVTDEVGLPDRHDKYWNRTSASARDRCTQYFRDYLLPTLKKPLVLVLDDLDRIYPYVTVVDLLELLRSWHEAAKTKPIFGNLKMVIAYSKDIADLPPEVMDIHRSPLNVGFPVQLGTFTSLQVEALARQYGLHLSASDLADLMRMLGGHPYLVRKALYELVDRHLSLSEFWQLAQLEDGLFRDHLLRHLIDLEADEHLKEIYKQALANDQVLKIETTNSHRLRNRGLVKTQADGVVVLCDLYRQYFRQKFLISAN